MTAGAARSPLAGRTVLAVFAHPDDESLACGGTLARLSDQGVRVILLCASRGERGSATGPSLNVELGNIRAREVRNAACVLGIDTLILLDHPDGDLRWSRVSELQAQLVAAISRYQPTAVITFGLDGLYWHQDHIGIHERTTAAVRAFGASSPPLYYVTMPRGLMRAVMEKAVTEGWKAPPKGFWSLEPDAFGLAAAAPTLIVDVRTWAPRKLAAMQCHRSQTGPTDPFAYLTDEETRQCLSIEHFHRAPDDDEKECVLELMGEAVTSS